MNHILIVCDVEHGHFTSDPKEYWDIREKLDKKFGINNYYTHISEDEDSKLCLTPSGIEPIVIQDFDYVIDIRSKKSK